MNDFEKELRRIFGESEVLSADTHFTGKTMITRIGQDLLGKVEIVTQGQAYHYSAFRVSVINRKEGVVDVQLLPFAEIFETSNTRFPYIREDGSEASWYCFQPTKEDYETLEKSVTDYLSFFADQDFGFNGMNIGGM